jgi:diamine N-acetyltransferase
MSKRHLAPLVNGRVRLRLLEEEDLPMTLAWRNQDHVRQWFLHSDVITADQHREWFNQYRLRDDDFVFVIEETETLQKPVGQVSLYHLDQSAGRAEFGRLIIGDPAAAGQGLAREATACLVGEALGPWQLGEVYLEVKDTNAAALAIYRRCGFQSSGNREGVELMRVLRSSAGE